MTAFTANRRPTACKYKSPAPSSGNRAFDVFSMSMAASFRLATDTCQRKIRAPPPALPLLPSRLSFLCWTADVRVLHAGHLAGILCDYNLWWDASIYLGAVGAYTAGTQAHRAAGLFDIAYRPAVIATPGADLPCFIPVYPAPPTVGVIRVVRMACVGRACIIAVAHFLKPSFFICLNPFICKQVPTMVLYLASIFRLFHVSGRDLADQTVHIA